MQRLLVLFAALAFLGMAAARAANPSLIRAMADLKANNGAAAQDDIWAARRSGVSTADTHHLMSHAFLLQGDAARALTEADPAQIPPQFADYAAKIRIKANLMRSDLRAAGLELRQVMQHLPNDDGLWADLARLRAKDGDLAGAITAGQKAAALNPHSIDALLLSATLARDQSGLAAALPWFNRILAVDPKNIPALLELAATQGDSGQAQAMIATSRRVLAIDKRNPQAFYLQAVIAARANRPDLARALLYRASPAIDELPGAMLLLGITELQAGNTEKAITQLSLLNAVQPNNIRVRRLLGLAYSKAGDNDQIIAKLKPMADRPDADSYILITLARAYENIDDRAAAAPYLDRAAQPSRGSSTPFDPEAAITLLARNDSENPNNAESAVPFMQGLILGGHLADAIGKAQNLAGLNPGVPLAHVLVGDTQMAAGQAAVAAAAYQRAAAITLTEPIVMRQVNALLHAGDVRGADLVLDRFLAQNPTNQTALGLAAGQDIAEGHWASAIARLNGLRARIGNCDVTILINLAIASFNAGDAPRALSFARAAYALAPANPAVTSTFGWLLFQTSLDKGTALALLEKAVSIAPNSPVMRLQLGGAYAALGRKAEARAVLRPIADNAALPQHDTVAKMIATL